MTVINRLILLALLAGSPAAEGQPDGVQLAISSEQQTSPIRVQDMEILALSALRKEFPRLSGVFASAHSCRLPDYGPFVSVTIQIPSFYFTRPVLQELDRRQRAAEEQARKVRNQLDRAAQLINLKSKEAGLLQRIEWEQTSKTKSKDTLESLQGQLSEIRKSLNTLESDQPELIAFQQSSLMNEIDLNKMLTANYQQLIDRVTKAMRDSLVENAPRLEGLKEQERVTINAYIRDNIIGSSGKSILFILSSKDIEEFKAGKIDLEALRTKVLIQYDTPQ